MTWFHGMKWLVRHSGWRDITSWTKTRVKRLFLSLLVLHRNAALKEYVPVTELSPVRLFHLLVLPAGRSQAPKFAPSTKTHSAANISNYSSQWELITITKSQKRRTLLLGDSNRLRSPYLQRCTAHSSVNFISIFSTEKAVSILAWGKRQRTRTTYRFSETQLYMTKFLLLPFQPKEGTRSCATCPLLDIFRAPPFHLRHLVVRREL